jgi:hypothetical protein
MATADVPAFPPLSQDARADVCVIGAGIAGLSTAYLLVQAGKSVVVLDDSAIGGGETGRTTAHLSNEMDDRYVEIEKVHGKGGARVAAESHTAAIDKIEEIADAEEIDCDFERVDGYLFLAQGDSDDTLIKELEAAHRAGLVDVALTRGPFDETGLTVHRLRADPVGAVLRADDPLARRDRLKLADLADRRWFLFPEGTDPIWQSYWNGGDHREGPVVRVVQECQQAVLWNGTVGMTLLDHEPPSGLTVVPMIDMPPSRVVVAWNEADTNPLIRSFVQLAIAAYRG